MFVFEREYLHIPANILIILTSISSATPALGTSGNLCEVRTDDPEPIASSALVAFAVPEAVS
jgi:hypothetical protein